MAVAGMVVEIREGSSEAVLHSLALVEDVTVYGIKDNHIITVMEADDLAAMEVMLNDIHAIEGVMGVFPVYAGGYGE